MTVKSLPSLVLSLLLVQSDLGSGQSDQNRYRGHELTKAERELGIVHRDSSLNSLLEEAKRRGFGDVSLGRYRYKNNRNNEFIGFQYGDDIIAIADHVGRPLRVWRSSPQNSGYVLINDGTSGETGKAASTSTPSVKTNPTAPSKTGYDLTKLQLLDPYLARRRRTDLPAINIIKPDDLQALKNGFSYHVQMSPEFRRVFVFPDGFGLSLSFLGGDWGRYAWSNESPLTGILHNELLTALTQSMKFNVSERPDAPFKLGSAIGVKSFEMAQTTIRGRSALTDLIEAILPGESYSYRRYRIFDAVRRLNYVKDERLLNVVVNLYFLTEGKIIVAGYGVGVSKYSTLKSTDTGVFTRTTIKSDDFLFDGVRAAVQDAINSISVVN